jgi:hypothetical protein
MNTSRRVSCILVPSVKCSKKITVFFFVLAAITYSEGNIEEIIVGHRSIFLDIHR